MFNGLGVRAVYALQRLQADLPLNPQGMGVVSPDSPFNTAISFVTNTNWQGYGGGATMGQLTQTLALTVQNFLSAAAVTIAASCARRPDERLGRRAPFAVDHPCPAGGCLVAGRAGGGRGDKAAWEDPSVNTRRDFRC